MSDQDIVDRLAAMARRMVSDSKTVAVAAADRIDNDTYTADVMAETASKLAGIVAKGWVDLASIALNQLDAEKLSAPAESVASSVRTTEIFAAELRRMNAAAPTRVTGNGVGAAITVMTELVNLAFHRNLDIASKFIGDRVPGSATVVTDQMTKVLHRAADQARTEVDDAAERLDTKGYGPNDWATTLTRLTDVALINGIELIGTAVVGPARYEPTHLTSEYFAVPGAHPDHRHELSLVAPLQLAGGGQSIGAECVAFDPPDCVLPAGTNRFRLRVKPTGLPSGVYLGSVWAVAHDAAGGQVGEPVSEEFIPVIIGL
jgi:hypothetical protein